MQWLLPFFIFYQELIIWNLIWCHPGVKSKDRGRCNHKLKDFFRNFELLYNKIKFFIIFIQHIYFLIKSCRLIFFHALHEWSEIQEFIELDVYSFQPLFPFGFFWHQWQFSSITLDRNTSCKNFRDSQYLIWKPICKIAVFGPGKLIFGGKEPFLITHFRAAFSGQRLPSGFEEASRKEIFQKFFFWFFEILRFYIFLVIPGSWGVHRYPWFQNQSINMARADSDKQTDK